MQRIFYGKLISNWFSLFYVIIILKKLKLFFQKLRLKIRFSIHDSVWIFRVLFCLISQQTLMLKSIFDLHQNFGLADLVSSFKFQPKVEVKNYFRLIARIRASNSIAIISAQFFRLSFSSDFVVNLKICFSWKCSIKHFYLLHNGLCMRSGV